MSGDATHPIAWAVWVDYWAGELAPEVESAVEEHSMACDECTRTSARVAAISEALRAALPPVISAAQVAKLVAQGRTIVNNDMQPRERRDVIFPREADLLLHRLGGLDLSVAEAVSFRMLVESSGEVLVALDDVPFERDQGRVLVACQKHYAVMPPDTVAEITVRDGAGAEHVATYAILHRFS
jgi:anti-sigma factor RsiW